MGSRGRYFRPAHGSDDRDLMAQVGLRVRELRRACELTQAQVAELAGWSVTKQAGIEQGRYAVTVVDVSVLARLLGGQPLWLLYGLRPGDTV